MSSIGIIGQGAIARYVARALAEGGMPATIMLARPAGTKPPAGWAGSPAGDALDLATLSASTAHFTGTARAAALAYPKNANVAAAVALAGVGFDETQVHLIADPGATQNTHQIEARGVFGSFDFTISGNTLPDNPKSSALAAMSAVRAVQNGTRWMRF